MILVSPSLEVLLLHRVQTSSSFPSAHVFPGGNIDQQDGSIPEGGIERHRDNHAYRVGALRELFEESGILLARKSAESTELISLPQETRDEGRRLVHSRQMPFQTWLHRQYPRAVLDTDGLIPFSHWITPANLPQRFTTQMYLYFLPAQGGPHPATLPAAESTPTNPESRTTNNFPPTLAFPASTAFIPSHDGNVENTAATFSPAATWLHLARSGSIILFPPQFLLLHLISHFLDNGRNDDEDNAFCAQQGQQQRIQRLRTFILDTSAYDDEDGVSSKFSPPYSEKCISPYALPMAQRRRDGKVVLGLDRPGPEVEGDGLAGDGERLVLVKWSKEGPREMEVRWRREIVEESGRSSDNVREESGGGKL